MTVTDAEALLREGRLDDSLARLQDAVRASPADPKLRVFLFQVLAVQGAWERALNQLQVIGGLDAEALPMVQTYREAIRCEVYRRRVFAGLSTPLAFGEPRQWFALLVEALRLSAAGQPSEAGAVRGQAFELAPVTPGSIDGRAFQWIADGDTRLGPVLEVIMNGRYYWMPFDTLRRIEIEAPSDLRDVVWLPAHLLFANGGDAVALLPTRYPGSETAVDPLLRLSRRTEWHEDGSGGFEGLGQRLLTTDIDEIAMMDAREIELDGDGAVDG